MNFGPPIDAWTTSDHETAEARLPAAGLLHMVTVGVIARRGGALDRGLGLIRRTPDSDSLIARMVLASRFSYE